MIKKQEINFKSRYAPHLNFALTLKEWFYCAECVSEADVISFYPKISTFMPAKSKKLAFTQHFVWRIKYSKFKRTCSYDTASVIWYTMPWSKWGMEGGFQDPSEQSQGWPDPALAVALLQVRNGTSHFQRFLLTIRCLWFNEICVSAVSAADIGPVQEKRNEQQQWLEGGQGWEWDVQCFRYLSVFFWLSHHGSDFLSY